MFCRKGAIFSTLCRRKALTDNEVNRAGDGLHPNDFAVRLWDVASEKIVLVPLRHSHGITSIAWEPDGRRLATGSIDQTVKIWDAATGREVRTLRGLVASITSLSWGPDGRLASGGGDGSTRIWDSIGDQESSVLPGHTARATSVSWSPDGKRLASGGDDGKVRIWDPVARKEALTFEGHDERRVAPQFGLIRSLAWSPDGRHLASAGLDGTVKVREAAGGRDVFILPADRGPVWSTAWSPDGAHLAAGSEDGTIRVVEGLGHVPKVRAFRAHQGRVRSLAWSPRGDRLASGGGDGLVKLWDPIRGAEIGRMTDGQSWVLGVAWSPDGKRLASASANSLVTAWDAETGRKLATMRGHNDFVDAVAWSPDGTRLASAGIDNSVRVWDPVTGEETFVLRGDSGMFHDVSWHPDGARLAAASSDGQVWVWDATRGFERDTTPRALPFIDRQLASGTAHGEDLPWYAESYIRAGRPGEALAVVRDDPSGLRKLAPRIAAAYHDLGDRQAIDKLVERHPGAAVGVGDRYAADRDWARAIVEYRRALADPTADGGVLTRLIAAFQSAGRTREAVPYLAMASSARPEDTILSLKLAALQAWFGQDGELAATRHRILAFAKGTGSVRVADCAAKVSSLLPSPDRTELAAALALGRKAVTLSEVGRWDHPWNLLALGMAEYRGGIDSAAEKALLAAAEAGRDNPLVTGTSAFYRAMCLYRQGKPAEARKLGTEAAARMKPLPADEQNPLAGVANHDDLILWLAYKEARSLINLDAAHAVPATSDGK